MKIFDFKPGTSPLLMSIPHVGEYIPNEIVEKLLPIGSLVPDTDWYLDRLYNFADDLGASVLRANYSRYVIDLNRAPDSRALYPGANNTELVPTSTFLEDLLYETKKKPGAGEIARRQTKWQSRGGAVCSVALRRAAARKMRRAGRNGGSLERLEWRFA